MDAQSAPLQGKSRRFTIAHHPRRRSKMFCPKCCRSLPPPAISRLEGTLFGHGFQAWAVYQRVVLRLSYRLITATMEDMFGERTSPTTVVNFVRSLADLYGPCEKANLDRLLTSPFIHADETRLSIQGTDYYAWILTDGRHVVLRLTETRETTMIRELLSDYKGVVVSNFYAGYDGVGCLQQSRQDQGYPQFALSGAGYLGHSTNLAQFSRHACSQMTPFLPVSAVTRLFP